MSELRVSCPNCNAIMIFDPEEGTKCTLCHQKLTTVEYMAKRIRKLGYSTEHTKNGLKIGNGLGLLNHSTLYKEIQLSMTDLSNASDLIKSLLELGIFLNLILTEVNPRANFCPICNSPLSYMQTLRSRLNGTHFIGCYQKNHHFIYRSVEIWLGSTLLKRYPKFKFTPSDSGVYVFSVDQKKSTKGMWLWKETEYTDIETNHGMINYQADGDQLAIWVPKNLLPGVIDIFSYLSDLNLKNVRIVRVNE